MLEPLPTAVIHHARHDPRARVGGVETFARTLERLFAEVRHTTPANRRVPGAPGEPGPPVPIICDNQHVLDWAPDIPVIGFQHGVAAVKMCASWSPAHWWLARRQRRAATRPNTRWAACAEWIGAELGRRYGNRAQHVIYHPVDTDRFDGLLDNEGATLVLHDARTRLKGRELMERLAAAMPEWRFEPLACPPEAVPDRMRRARAFIHLSRYEGNSIVCLEAMAMNLPCLFTDVGLMRDHHRPPEVDILDARAVYADPTRAVEAVRRFLGSLDTRSPQPRQWVLEHATLAQAQAGWREVLSLWERMHRG